MSNLDFIRELGIEDVNLGGFSTEWLGSGSSLDSFSPADDAMSLFSIFKTQYGHEIDVFLAFTPMLLTEKDDKLTVKWIIMKETT